MKKDQKLTRLGPRIKLCRPQMQEWSALLIHQSQLCLSTNEHEEQKNYLRGLLSISK